MCKKVFVKMPKLKEENTGAVIVSWNKDLCEKVNQGDILFAAEIDKVICEIEAECDGIMNQRFFEEGETIFPGQTVASVLSYTN